MANLLQGDCAEKMRDLADNSIDAIVTDPPYGLAFMGAKWDNFGGKSCGNDSIEERKRKAKEYRETHKGCGNYPNSHSSSPTRDEMANFQTAMTPIFAEALRVAKPGTHLLAFGGTRTYHRLACAIEDAGWEVRDCIMWVYGCLSEDTEILTCKGWTKIGTIQIGDRIHAYDRATKTFRYEEVKDTFLYDYDDTAYRIQSDCTDQLVSRNHRVIVERGGVEVFEYAENLAQEQEARVPVLEGLQSLLDHIPMLDERAGSSQQNMFAGMCGGVGAENAKATLGRPFTEQDLPRLRKGILQASRMAEEGEDKLLLCKLQEQGRVRPSADEIQQGTPNSDNGSAETDFKSKDDRRSESRMERRSDISASQGKLCECSVCALPEGISANGSEGRICNGASACGSESNRKTAKANGDCSSYQPRPSGQQERESDVILDEPNAQIIRGAWKTTTTLARITPVQYKGRMWCVSVPSGAIVARRNGKIFITGNSGFPKSMDVSKAIDKAMGAERKSRNGEGAHEGNIDFGMKNRCPKCGKPYFSGNPCTCPREDSIPATPEAAAWNGWGTCLKPACEPIVVARKPLEGTIAANCLKYGTGTINIDGCRVPTETPVIVHSPARKTLLDSGHKDLGTWANNKGRFPANLIHDGSDEVLALFPDSKGQCGAVKGTEPSRTGTNGIYGNYNGQNSMFPSNDSGSAARFFYCAKASRSERGEGNIHPTVKPLALMRYLVRLVTRKGGTVLDPFMGSGTTGIAAIQEGMEFVGIERDPHYLEIASRRIAEAKPLPPTASQQELPL